MKDIIDNTATFLIGVGMTGLLYCLGVLDKDRFNGVTIALSAFYGYSCIKVFVKNWRASKEVNPNH